MITPAILVRLSVAALGGAAIGSERQMKGEMAAAIGSGRSGR